MRKGSPPHKGYGAAAAAGPGRAPQPQPQPQPLPHPGRAGHGGPPPPVSPEVELDRALSIAERHSQYSKLAPEYKALFKQLWSKHVGPGKVYIAPQAARRFAGDMVAKGWSDWKLTPQDEAVLERFAPVGGMHVTAFAEFSENDSFDADAALLRQASHTGVATSAHESWLQQGGSSAVALQAPALEPHRTAVIDWAQPAAARAKQLVAALRRDGVCILVNHPLKGHLQGNEERLRDFFGARQAMQEAQLREMQLEMQRRPMMKCAVGYTPERVEQLNPFTAPDMKETYDFSEPGSVVGQLHDGQTKWPKEAQGKKQRSSGEVAAGFRERCIDYLKTATALARELVGCITQEMGISPSHMDPHFREPLVVGRLIRYPPQQTAHVPMELGAGSHIDYGAVTLVAEDSEGLQVIGRGEGAQWQRVPHVPGGLIVQTGYVLEKLTNGQLMAMRHRVINNSSADRHATAVFYDPNPLAEIGPLPNFVTAQCPQRYEKCVAGKKGVRYGDPRYLLRARGGPGGF